MNSKQVMLIICIYGLFNDVHQLGHYSVEWLDDSEQWISKLSWPNCKHSSNLSVGIEEYHE